MREIRLQKFIADCGITSRRKAEELIVQGRVKINGDQVTVLGTKVNPDEDVVMVDNESISSDRVQRIYVLLHKPRGVMTTLNDPEGRSTVLDLVKEVPERIYPVGRLDYLSEGLLLLTNDGDLANQIMHPSSEVVKVYEVKVFGAINEKILRTLRNGVQTEEGFLKPKSVRVIKQLPGKTWLEFRLIQGRNREIRRICEACELTVDKLKRVAIGGISIDGIAPGKYRFVSKSQLLAAIAKTPTGEAIEYQSPKKTIRLGKRGHQDCSLATDEGYLKLRRDTYYNSLKEIEERKRLEAKQERTEAFEAKEAAHQRRKDNKKKREIKKFKQKKYVHAQVVK